MSCHNCLCGVPSVPTTDDLPDPTTSGLCDGAMRTVDADGSLWILRRDLTLNPLLFPLQRTWILAGGAAAGGPMVLKFAGSQEFDGAGPHVYYMADDAVSVGLEAAAPGYPVLPPTRAATFRRLSVRIKANDLANAMLVEVQRGGVTFANINVPPGTANTTLNLESVVPLNGGGDQRIDVRLSVTGTESTAQVTLSAAVELAIAL